MNRTVIITALCLNALGVASCTPRADPLPEVTEPAPVAAPAPDRFTTTVLSQSSTGHVKTALIVDNQTGCIMSMVAPNGPRPMMVDGKWAGCEEQPVPAVVADAPIPAPEVAQ